MRKYFHLIVTKQLILKIVFHLTTMTDFQKKKITRSCFSMSANQPVIMVSICMHHYVKNAIGRNLRIEIHNVPFFSVFLDKFSVIISFNPVLLWYNILLIFLCDYQNEVFDLIDSSFILFIDRYAT